MNRRARNSIFFTLIVIAIAGASIGYYFYNKGPLDVKNSEAILVNAVELYGIYIQDSVTQKNYTGNVLEVTGEVAKISLNPRHEKVVLLKTNAVGAFINCTMEENAENMALNDLVKIKGICSGIGEGDMALGIKGDVYLTRCFLIKNK
jgi:hypothetical protein